MTGMPSVTTPILPADIRDDRFRSFQLDLERGNQRIVSIHDNVVCFFL